MEFVYVVPRGDLFPDCYPQGLVPFGSGSDADGLDAETFARRVREHGFFVERSKAEVTPEWKQVIPYIVTVANGDVLVMRRLSAGGEARLHDKTSIGVGGHINPEDADSTADAPSADPAHAGDPIEGATWREIGEELVVDGETSLRSVGILNDDSNAVGAVHVGLVRVLEVRRTVCIRERQVLEGELVHPSALASMRAEGVDFETCSAVLVERLAEVLPDAQLVHS